MYLGLVVEDRGNVTTHFLFYIILKNSQAPTHSVHHACLYHLAAACTRTRLHSQVNICHLQLCQMKCCSVFSHFLVGVVYFRLVSIASNVFHLKRKINMFIAWVEVWVLFNILGTFWKILVTFLFSCPSTPNLNDAHYFTLAAAYRAIFMPCWNKNLLCLTIKRFWTICFAINQWLQKKPWIRIETLDLPYL